MPNLHTLGPDTLAEEQAIDYDLLPVALLTHSGLSVPGSGMALANVMMTGYVRRGTALVYVSQSARTITLSGSAGTYWLALFHDTHSAAAGWTRVPGSHYLWQGPTGTPPANPSGGLVVASVVVTGTNITAVTPLTGIASPLMSQQHADAVAITGGTISIGGHASTGVLDVQGSVAISGPAYPCVRLWPVAPIGAVLTEGLRIEASTGAAVATTSFQGVQVGNQPTMAAVQALALEVTAGPGRYNLYASGNAFNYLAGNTGINTTPRAETHLTLLQNRSSAWNALMVTAAGNDSGGLAVGFTNVAGTQVGSIYCTATTTAFNTSSDRRLKRHVQPLANALATLRQVRPVSFYWNQDDSYGEGWLADELQQVLPHAVTGEPDALNDDGTIKPQGIDFGKVVPMLTQAVKELLQRVEALESALGV